MLYNSYQAGGIALYNTRNSRVCSHVEQILGQNNCLLQFQVRYSLSQIKRLKELCRTTIDLQNGFFFYLSSAGKVDCAIISGTPLCFSFIFYLKQAIILIPSLLIRRSITSFFSRSIRHTSYGKQTLGARFMCFPSSKPL